MNIIPFAETTVAVCEDLYQFPPVNPRTIQFKLSTNDTTITDDTIHLFAVNNYDNYHNKEMFGKLTTQCEFVNAVDKLPDNIVCLESWLIHIKAAKLDNVFSLVYSLKLKFGARIEHRLINSKFDNPRPDTTTCFIATLED